MLTSDIPRIMKLVGGVKTSDKLLAAGGDDDSGSNRHDVMAQIRIPSVSQRRMTDMKEMVPMIALAVLIAILAMLVALNFEELQQMLLRPAMTATETASTVTAPPM
eukprot:gene34325-57076_t